MKKFFSTVKSNLTSAAWWKAALKRAGRTAAQIAIPYFLSAQVFADVPYLALLSATSLGFGVSVITSVVAELPEVAGVGEPWWYSALSRFGKTFGQALLAGIGTAAFIQDVDWPTILQLSTFAAITSVLMSLVGTLPEASTPQAVAVGTTTTFNVTTNQPQEVAVPAVVAVAPEQVEQTDHGSLVN